MTAKQVIYQKLKADAALDGMLARKVDSAAVAIPAIYDRWPGDNAIMPYIILSYQPREGNHFAQVAARLSIDIFVDNSNTVLLDDIREQLEIVLDREKLISPTHGEVLIYKDGLDDQTGSETPGVVHWTVEYLVKYWRKPFIASLN